MEKLSESERTRISKMSEKTLNKHLVEDAGWEEAPLDQISRTERLQAWAQVCVEKRENEEKMKRMADEQQRAHELQTLKLKNEHEMALKQQEFAMLEKSKQQELAMQEKSKQQELALKQKEIEMQEKLKQQEIALKQQEMALKQKELEMQEKLKQQEIEKEKELLQIKLEADIKMRNKSAKTHFKWKIKNGKMPSKSLIHKLPLKSKNARMP